MDHLKTLKFPPGFTFGVATSSYQIEGAAFKDGRVPSHWDTFSHTPGKTHNGDTGDVACDHYHRYREDIELMAQIGVSSYRFSFAWPRIMTEANKVSQKGLDFYQRVLDSLLEHNIAPAATIYHWDLPQWLADRGGWVNRDTVGYFGDFAEVLFKTFGDRIHLWITHNEPWCSSFLSYGLGEHAPGHHDWREAVVAAHHILLSHGETVLRYRDMGMKGDIGITLNLTPVYAKTDREEDREAATRADGFSNRWFLDPILQGAYPDDMLELFRAYVKTDEFIRDGDLAAISRPLDFLGVNYYTRSVVFQQAHTGLLNLGQDEPPMHKATAMGWEVYPDALYSLLRRLHTQYPSLPLYITENGAAYPDAIAPDGMVHDTQRIGYLEQHLLAAQRFAAEGGLLKGYYLWSLLDNFEWGYGYSKRFGIVHVDFSTQKRLLKESAHWYRNVIASQPK